MRQKYRTTCFADEPLHYEKSFEDHPIGRGDVVGFRLVHDDSGQVFRGGSWYGGPLYARVALRDWSDPASRGDYLGFRLARNEGGT